MKTPLTPLGVGVPYNNEYLKGIILGRERTFLVKRTGFEGDTMPYPGTFLINNPGVGNSRTGMTYMNYLGDNPSLNIYVPESQRIASIVTQYFRYNTVLTGVDWRHFGNIDDYIRGVLDYLEYNDGYVIPVDLMSFDATVVGKRVEINWETASEINSEKFVVEKAIWNDAGASQFNAIETIQSVGNSNTISKYGPVVDNQVDYNNKYVYRLKMYERNGEFKYSDEKVVTLIGLNGKLSLGDVTPNPVNGIAKIEVNTEKSLNITLTLLDLNGNIVNEIYNGLTNSGSNVYELNSASIANGTYTIVLNADGVILTTKLNVVK